MHHPGVPQKRKMGSREMNSKMVVVVVGPALIDVPLLQLHTGNSSTSRSVDSLFREALARGVKLCVLSSYGASVANMPRSLPTWAKVSCFLVP